MDGGDCRIFRKRGNFEVVVGEDGGREEGGSKGSRCGDEIGGALVRVRRKDSERGEAIAEDATELERDETAVAEEERQRSDKSERRMPPAFSTSQRGAIR